MRKPPDLIGIYSPTMGGGKSLIANELVIAHGYTRLRFAGALKKMVLSLFEEMGFEAGDVFEMVEGAQKESAIPGLSGATPRSIMQTLGTEWGRELVQSDLWVQIIRMRVDKIIQGGGRVVIDDVRFVNEFEFITSYGMDSRIWRVTRPGQLTTQHASEGLLEGRGFDSNIPNHGSVEDLFSKVRHLLS